MDKETRRRRWKSRVVKDKEYYEGIGAKCKKSFMRKLFKSGVSVKLWCSFCEYLRKERLNENVSI